MRGRISRTGAWMAHHLLAPGVVPDVVTLAKGLGGDRFLPITYQKDWELVRTVAASAGELFTREAFDKAAAGKK